MFRHLFFFHTFPVCSRLILSLLLILTALPGLTKAFFTLSEQVLAQAEKKFGPGARSNLLAWEQMIQEDKSATDKEKLIKVNSFFNTMEFINDILLWKKEDYWATPVEFLASGGGDCEDFSIAKYFTLKALGIKEEKLSMTYVKAIELNQAHMVLTYYAHPGAEPLVLDNLINEIKPASRRSDLLPVYSFNGSGLWLARQRGRGTQVGTSQRIKNWQELLKRMEDSLN